MAARRISQGNLTDVEIRGWIRAGSPIAKSDGGGLAIKDVSPHDVVDLLKRHVANGWREVETLLVVCRELFKHAAGQPIRASFEAA
jgi:hypothetical protein